VRSFEHAIALRQGDSQGAGFLYILGNYPFGKPIIENRWDSYVFLRKMYYNDTQSQPNWEQKLSRDDFTKPIFPDIPDFYVDRVKLTVTVFGVNFTFGLGNPHPESPGNNTIADVIEMVRLRMSLEHAKIMTMILKKQIKQYETSTQTEIAIPKSVLEALALTEETW
jgi:hypothetical protein